MSLDVLACIDELVDRITHREPYTTVNGATLVHQWHTTRHPSLLAQLGEAIEPSNTLDDTGRATPTSKPTARLEALDALTRIDQESSRWLRILGYDDPGDTAQCVRALAPHTNTHSCGLPRKERYRGCCQHHDLTGDISAWWTHARIITGWDTAAWRPANTCPLCANRGSLRIRLADHLGLCTECGETWEPDTIGLLADHIRLENADTPAIVDYVALP